MATAADTVRTAYDHYLNGRLEELLACFSHDIHWRSIGPTKSIPWAGDYRGRDAVREWFRTLSGEMKVCSYEVKHFVAEGDRVCVLSDVVVCRPDGGPEVHFDKCDVIRVENGEVAEFIEFYDTAAVEKMLQARGAPPVKSPAPFAASSL